MKKLKPCPFCGGDAILIIKEDCNWSTGTIKNLFLVRCDQCQISTKYYDSRIWQDRDGEVHIERNGAECAIDIWNRRVGDQE